MSYVAGSMLAPGTTVAGYRIEALIGRGGMGAVYRAEEEGLGRKVALKVIAPELAQDERFRERFLRESRIAASLDHPHVIPIYQAGEEDGLLFLAMRYVEGTDLAKLLAEEGALEPRRTVDILSQVAEALDAAHEKGLVHRDVKPSNILIAEAAGSEHCYLSDFGLTKRTGSLSGVSAPGDVVGTLEYVAPEQITGDPLDERADVYSLGCVLYECLTGQSPFPRATDVALLWAHVHEEPTPPSKAKPELPKALDTVLARALAKEPGRRYRSAGELIAATRSALRLGDTAPASKTRSRRIVVGAIALALVVLAAVLAFVLRSGSSGLSTVAPNSVGVVDSGNGKVVSQISVGTSPNAIAVGPDAVWVTNTNDDTVSRIDASTNAVRQTIEVGVGPVGVAVGSGAVWVANGLDGTVSRIDPTISREVEKIVVGNGPSGVAYGEGFVWVTNSVDGTVSRIDPSGNRAPRTFPAAIGASGVAVGFGRVWVVSPASGTVVELDPRSGQVLHTIAVGVEPSAVAIGAAAVWVANRADGTVSKIDPRTGSVKGLVPDVGPSPNAVAADAKTLWVASQGDGKLRSFDPSTGERLATTELGSPPAGVALTPGSVYAAVQSAGLEHRGGELRVGSPGAVTTIDPARGYVPIFLMTNDGLVGFRKVGGIEGDQIVPDLAVAIPPLTDGGKTYTFQVRSGIRYSNGRLVQPDDFKRAVERLFEAQGNRDNDFERVVGAIRCVRGKPCDLGSGIATDRGARTVTFHLTAPDPDFLAKLAQSEASAVPAGTPARDVGTHPIPATGPYRIAFFGKETIRLVRNRFFREWSADAQPQGFPDSISWSWRFSDNQAALRAVEQRAADIALGSVFSKLPKNVIDRLSVLYPGQLHVNTELNVNLFFLNTRAAPFTDVRVRRAVNLAFDRQAFGRVFGRSYAATCRYLPPGTLGYQPTCPYGPGGVAGLEAARRLVRSSGTAGARVTVWVPGGDTVHQGRFLVLLLDSLGYRATLKVVNGWNAYYAQVADSRVGAQTGYIGYFGVWPSPLFFLPPIVSCAAFVPASPAKTRNPSEFCDPSIDAQIAHASAVQAQDPPAATVLWQRVESALALQAPYVPIYNGRNVDFVSKRVGNYQYNPTSGALLSQLWVK